MIRKILHLIYFVYDICVIFLKAYKDIIKYTTFIFFIAIFIIILNSFAFRYILDVNNNVSLFIMIVISRSFSSALRFIYDEAELFKSIYVNRKKISEKFESKIKKDAKFENVVLIIAHFSICAISKDYILILTSLDKSNLLHLCLLAVIMLIISIASKSLITFFIKHITVVKEKLRLHNFW